MVFGEGEAPAEPRFPEMTARQESRPPALGTDSEKAASEKSEHEYKR